MEGKVRFNDPVNTLAYHTQGRPLTNAVDMRELRVVDFAKAGRDFLAKHSTVAPETDALFFYAGNHALAAIRARYSLHEPLEEKDLELVRRYYQYGNAAFQRMTECPSEGSNPHQQFPSSSYVMVSADMLDGARLRPFLALLFDER